MLGSKMFIFFFKKGIELFAFLMYFKYKKNVNRNVQNVPFFNPID